MKIQRILVRSGVVLTAASLFAAPSGATSLVHQGLDQLALQSELILRATVLDIHSYWNAGHTFILTDVHVRPAEVLKGAAAGDVTFTVMGGTVGDVTTLVIGGADLAPGSEYVLFLAHADLPGAAHRLTVRDHAQGAFDVVGGRAFSQALADPLLPDARGETAVPGAAEGLALDDLVRGVHEYSNRQ